MLHQPIDMRRDTCHLVMTVRIGPVLLMDCVIAIIPAVSEGWPGLAEAGHHNCYSYGRADQQDASAVRVQNGGIRN